VAHVHVFREGRNLEIIFDIKCEGVFHVRLVYQTRDFPIVLFRREVRLGVLRSYMQWIENSWLATPILPGDDNHKQGVIYSLDGSRAEVYGSARECQNCPGQTVAAREWNRMVSQSKKCGY
jgi:hypothetical protein